MKQTTVSTSWWAIAGVHVNLSYLIGGATALMFSQSRIVHHGLDVGFQTYDL